MKKSIYIFFVYLNMNGFLYAGEVIHSHINNDGDRFVLHLEMRIDADYDSVYSTLLDFDNLKYLSDTIIESELLDSQDNLHITYVRSEGCILFFCQSVVQNSTVTELGKGLITAVIDPNKSDLRFGEISWQVIDEGETTIIINDVDIIPDFWVPPLIGSYFFKQRLIEEGEKLINGIENVFVGDEEND